MDIETSSAIKLFFPNPSLALVYFEAVANALDAGATQVKIDIDIQSFTAPETLKITVKDNGTGFTDENLDRFKTLMKPKDGFHKGIGRLVFLNYFEIVEVSSKWEDNHRTFSFKENFDGNVPIKKLSSKVENSTCLTFNKFSKDKIKSYDDLKPLVLKERIIEQFLPTLNQLRYRGVDFKITIDLSTKENNSQKEFFSSEVVITKSDLPEMTLIEIKDISIDSFSKIEMSYYIKQDAERHSFLSAVSIDGRTIPVNLIKPSSIPIDYSVVFIFSSEMFHASADSSRQKLILPESVQESALYAVLRREIGKVLAKEIPKISETNVKTKEQFEEKFPHLLGYFEETTVGLIDRDEAISDAQQKFFQIQKEVLQCEKLSDTIYKKSLDMSSRALTEYVLYRDMIIRRMKEMTQDNSEADIHNLIVPRTNNYSQSSLTNDVYQNNAWLLDDKFMTFRTILSEARMDKVISDIRLDDEI